MTTRKPWQGFIEAAGLIAFGVLAGEVVGHFVLRGMPGDAVNALRLGSALPGIGMLAVRFVRGRAAAWLVRFAFAASVMGSYWLVAVRCLSGDTLSPVPFSVLLRVWWPSGTAMGAVTVVLMTEGADLRLFGTTKPRAGGRPVGGWGGATFCLKRRGHVL